MAGLKCSFTGRTYNDNYETPTNAVADPPAEEINATDEFIPLLNYQKTENNRLTEVTVVKIVHLKLWLMVKWFADRLSYFCAFLEMH